MQSAPTRPLLPLVLLACLAAAPAVRAQSLTLEAKVQQQAFVLNEAVRVDLTVQNLGGSPFIIDDYGTHKDNSVRIHVKSAAAGYLTAKAGTPLGQVMVMPGEAETYAIDLGAWFPLAEEGRYHVQILVTRGEEVAATRLMMFDVVKGIEIGSITRPLPEYDTVSRKYTLLYWPREQVEVLFLRVDEIPPGRCVGLTQLGNIVRFVEPRIEFDATGTLTVLHQSSRDLFVRTVIRTDRDTLEVVDRQRLVDPNPSLFGRAALRQQQAEESRTAAGADGFERRVHPSEDESEKPEEPTEAAPPAKAPRRTLR